MEAAAAIGILEELKRLVDGGLDVNQRNRWERTPLIWAAWAGHTDCVEYLIKNGAQLHLEDDARRTALHMVAERGHLEVMKKLLEGRQDINQRDRWNRTPLMCAAEREHTDCVEYLLQNGAQLDLKDAQGRTVLQLASDMGYHPMAKMLQVAQHTSSKGITAVGLYHYQAAYKDEITINKGDIIVNIERVSQAQWKGTTPNGKRGLFPSNYVKLHEALKETHPEEITSAYKRACAEGQAPHYQGSIMAVGKSAAGKTSFKKRLTGEEINEEHLVTNALETDLCTIDITNLSLAWEIHAKQRTDLLEDEITLKIKEFVKDQSMGKTRRHTQYQNTNANLSSEEEITLPSPPTRRKKESRLVRFFSRFGGKKEKDMNLNTSSSHRKDEVAIKERKKNTANSQEASLPSASTNLHPEDRFRLEMITKPGRSQDITTAKKTDHSLIKVWDFGGQKVYYILHTVFLRVTCVYVLVVDLSAEITGSHSRETGAMITEPDFESFEYWLNTIMSHMRKGAQNVDKGNVIVLGTHIDKLHPSKTEQRRLSDCYFKQLKGILQTKQHKNLVVSFFAVDNIDGDHETYGKIRETLLEAVKANCHWGEMRPIRYLQMTQRLQLLQEDTSISQLKGNLVPLSDVMEMAKKYNINTEKDVKAYLGFSHLVGDVTYFDTPELQHFVIPNPQWLCNVFRAIITVDQFYPNDRFPESEVHALNMLKKNGMLDRKGPLLPLLWESFLYEEEPLHANLPPQRKEEQLHETAVEYLLKLMIQFDLVPLGTKSLPQGFPEMGHINPPLFLVFHSSLESHKSFQLSLETGDEFLPHGFFHRLISRCVKEKWKWTGEKSQNVAYFLVDECMTQCLQMPQTD